VSALDRFLAFGAALDSISKAATEARSHYLADRAALATGERLTTTEPVAWTTGAEPAPADPEVRSAIRDAYRALVAGGAL